MRKLFDLLTRKEKSILGILFILVLGALCLLLFVGISQKRSFTRAEQGKTELQRELASAQKKRDGMAEEWELWKAAGQDYQKIKEEYLYQAKDALPLMRADVERILQKARVRVPQIRYEYEEFEEEHIQLIRFTFSIRGTYSRLKSFVHEIETFPKLIVMEKIDFVDIQPQSGFLTLRIHLVGYHDV
jgi:Tfp pilus assembly protein PilO